MAAPEQPSRPWTISGSRGLERDEPQPLVVLRSLVEGKQAVARPTEQKCLGHCLVPVC